MSFSATFTKTLAGLDRTYSVSETFTAGGKIGINETIATGTTHQPVNFEFGTGSGILLAMYTNTLYPITIKTNSTGSPTNTFTFSSSDTQIFTDITGQDVDSLNQPFQDISGLYVSNTGTTSLNLVINSLYDPTP